MNDLPADILYSTANELVARAAVGEDAADRPPAYRAVGLSLAVASGIFIGISFVLKKVGLLKANEKYNEEAGEGYGYLKNVHWWGGMTLMIVGEVCNFVAYAFVDAILVTPLGALSVVVTTVLSAIFLKERLSFVGKIGCFNCIIGSIVIVMNAPEQSAVADIQQMKGFVIAPGFLSYAGVIIIGCGVIAFWAGPRYGKKSMLVYLSVCSLIGGLSVVATQGLGSAVVAQAGGKPQFNQWFLYVLLVFVIATLLTEIVYLNKALNLFNAALVTPTYYVFFTSATIVTSAILFRGFKGTPIQIATVIMGFLVICSGVVLLQMSKSAKDVPDAAVFKGDLDQIRQIGEQEQPESEPKADALRGTSALLRRISTPRRKMEEQEAVRLREEKNLDHLEPLRENEIVEWDGLRRRKTIIGEPGSAPVRRQTIHPPLGMSKFPDPEPEDEHPERRDSNAFFDNIRTRARSVLHRDQKNENPELGEGKSPVAMTSINVHSNKSETPILPYGPGSLEEAQEHIYGLPRGLRKQQDKVAGIPAAQSPQPPQTTDSLQPAQQARRQFSFTNFLNRRSVTPNETEVPAPNRPRLASRASSHEKRALKNATEEERLGLVQGDSSRSLLKYASPERTNPPTIHVHSPSSSISSQSDDYFYPSPPRDPQYVSRAASDEEKNPLASAKRPTQDYSHHKLPPRVARPASPPHLPLPTYNLTSNTSTYQRPKPPTKSHTSERQQFQSQAPVVPRQDQTQQRVMPVATSFDPFLSSSTSHLPSLPYQDQGFPSRGLEGVGLAGKGGDEEDSTAVKKRFQEKSRREREERRKRASLKPGERATSE